MRKSFNAGTTRTSRARRARLTGDLFYFAIKVVFPLVAMLAVYTIPGQFVNSERALDAARNSGLENVELVQEKRTFAPFRGCEGSESAAFVVRGTNAQGRDVEATVCSKVLFKGDTIRY